MGIEGRGTWSALGKEPGKEEGEIRRRKMGSAGGGLVLGRRTAKMFCMYGCGLIQRLSQAVMFPECRNSGLVLGGELVKCESVHFIRVEWNLNAQP